MVIYVSLFQLSVVSFWSFGRGGGLRFLGARPVIPLSSQTQDPHTQESEAGLNGRGIESFDRTQMSLPFLSSHLSIRTGNEGRYRDRTKRLCWSPDPRAESCRRQYRSPTGSRSPDHSAPATTSHRRTCPCAGRSANRPPTTRRRSYRSTAWRAHRYNRHSRQSQSCSATRGTRRR